MKKKFTLLITVTALLLGGSGVVYGQGYPTDPTTGSDNGKYRMYTTAPNTPPAGWWASGSPSDHSGSIGMILLDDIQTGAVMNGTGGCGPFVANSHPAQAWVDAFISPVRVYIPVNGSTWLKPNHYQYFKVHDLHAHRDDYATHVCCGGLGCPGGESQPYTQHTHNRYLDGEILVVAGSDVRLKNNLIWDGNANDAKVTLPTNDEYSIRFDVLYTGTGGDYPSTTGTITISPNAWTTFDKGQGIGFLAGIQTQKFTVEGGGGTSSRAVPVTPNEGEYPGTRLMLGNATVGQNLITVDTKGTAGKAVYVFNYTTDHDVSIGYNNDFQQYKVDAGDLFIRNDNVCKDLLFGSSFQPNIVGAGNIYINENGADPIATDNPQFLVNSADRGLTYFHNGAIFNFGANTGQLSIEGGDVQFNDTVEYISTANNLFIIAAKGPTCKTGNMLFNGGVSVTKSQNHTLWIAKNDIETTATAPVVYNLSSTAKTNWRAGNNIITGSQVNFTNTGSDSTKWYAMNNINTKEGVYFTHTGTGTTYWNAVRSILAKDTVIFDHSVSVNPPALNGNWITLKADLGDIAMDKTVNFLMANDSSINILAENMPSDGNISFFDSLAIIRINNGTPTGYTNIIAGNNIYTAMVDYSSINQAGDNTNIISHMGDIWLGYNYNISNPTLSSHGTISAGPPPHATLSYDENRFVYSVPVATTGGKLLIRSGDQDPGETTRDSGGNIYFTHIVDSLAKGLYDTEVSIPFSNRYNCDEAWNGPAAYDSAGIIGGVARCQISQSHPIKCDTLGLKYFGYNGQLLFDAGTRGNIIINNGGYLNFQDGNGNAKFLTRWGDIDMRYPFDVDSMRGALLFLASSELPDKLNTDLCGCIERRNNVYMQDFKYNPMQNNSGSVFIGADNNIKMQYGGLKATDWMGNKYDPFYNTTEYPCGSGFIHCDADTSQNQARDLILDYGAINAGGMGMVASDMIDVYKNMVYNGGSGAGLSSVPGYGSLHGEGVAGYGLYIKTQANKKNWNMSDHDINSTPDPEEGAACAVGNCTTDFLHNIARVTFHADARIYAENQKVLVSSPVLETFGNLDLNTHLRKGGKTSILIQTDSLICHDSLIIDGPKTQLTTWSGLKYDMPVIRLGHQRFTPPTAEGAGCPGCFVHPEDPYGMGTKELDTVFVTFRNDASINRLHTLVGEHAVISFLTDSFDHKKGNPTLNAKFYTDIFKVRNRVQLYNDAARTKDGHFELVSETQMGTKDYAGIYSRHLHMEPIGPSCSKFGYSQLWLQDHALDVITSSTFGGFGYLHADVHVENGANLFPGFASLGKDGNCYEQKAGILKMKDLRLDKGANIKISLGEQDADKSFTEVVECDKTFETIALGRYADCLDVDSLTIYGSVKIDVVVRSGLELSEGESRCYPIMRYKSTGPGDLSNLKMEKLRLTSADHKTIEGNYYLTLDLDTVCNMVYLCIATIPDPVIHRNVIIPSVEGVTTDPVAGKYSIRSGNDFKFTAKYTTGYPLKVLTGRVINGAPEEIFGTKNANGEYEYVIKQVRQEITLVIGPDPATANDDVDNGKMVWSHGNTIYIKVDREDIASIYSVAGQLVKRIDLPEGTTPTNLSRGIYIVTLKDGSVHKVIVR